MTMTSSQAAMAASMTSMCPRCSGQNLPTTRPRRNRLAGAIMRAPAPPAGAPAGASAAGKRPRSPNSRRTGRRSDTAPGWRTRAARLNSALTVVIGNAWPRSPLSHCRHPATLDRMKNACSATSAYRLVPSTTPSTPVRRKSASAARSSRGWRRRARATRWFNWSRAAASALAKGAQIIAIGRATTPGNWCGAGAGTSA